MQGQAQLQPVVSSLGDVKHLQRDRAAQQLQAVLSGAVIDGETLAYLEDGLRTLLGSDGWEQRLGGLLGAKVLATSGQLSSALQAQLVAEALRLLEDPEVRVRLAVGELLGALAAAGGVPVWDATHARVLESIREHFDRDGEGERAASGSLASSRNSSSSDLIGSLLENSYRVQKPGTGELRHGTEGWRCLETSMRTLQALVQGCGPPLAPHLTPEVLELLQQALQHPNRFVREAGHMTIRYVVVALHGPALDAMAPELAARLADGLTDNWSQVRLTACVSVRSFLSSLGPEAREAVLPILLGPMCLNRYYVAEGVKRYAQESWRIVFGNTGRQAIARHIEAVLDYYIAQTKALNFTVREAACSCLAELAEKVEVTAVGPRVSRMVRALLSAFRDMSWPVRDAACIACGRCMLAYPEQLRPLRDEVFALWLAHLWDNIPSVRENTARALATSVRAYGRDALDKLLPALRDLLPRAAQQPPEPFHDPLPEYAEARPGASGRTAAGAEGGTRARAGGGGTAVAADGVGGSADGGSSNSEGGATAVARRWLRDNDSKAHSDQEMFSCNSLISRFGNAYQLKGDGCMDYGFPREREPWEASDGALFMLRELAAVAPDVLPEFLPAVAELARVSGAPFAFSKMRATLWKALPAIAKGIGKRAFKPHLELLLTPMFRDLLGHESELTACAAGACIAALRDWLGPAILIGRLTPDQAALLARSQFVHSTAPAAAGTEPARGQAVLSSA